MNILKFTNFAIRRDQRIALLLRVDSTKKNEQPLKQGKLEWSRFVRIIAVASALFCGLEPSVGDDLFVSDLSGNQVRKFTGPPTFTPILPIPFFTGGGGGGGEGVACLTVSGQAEMFVASNSSTIDVYNPITGAYVRQFAGGLNTVAALSLSHDGLLLYAADWNGGAATGKIVAFSTLDPNPLKTPIYTVSTSASHDVRVGPDGSVFASYFGRTGSVKFSPDLSSSSVFIPTSSLTTGDTVGAMTFDAGGDLWFSVFRGGAAGAIYEYGNTSGSTGIFVQRVVSPLLANPFGLDLGPDGNIYVANFFGNNVLKLDLAIPLSPVVSQVIGSPDAGGQPKYVTFSGSCVTVPGEMFPAEQCCGEKPHFADPAYTSVFTGQVAVSTEFAPLSTDFVLGVFDLKNQASAPLNSNYAPPIYHGPASSPWTRSRLGGIFGIALDEFGSIYVTATTAYNGDFFPSGATAGEIYKINGTTGAITTFKTLPNTGAGLGNIAYDCTHRNFYVSNTDDGLIYRLDLSGNILSTWDHGLNLPTANPPSAAIPDNPTNVFTALGRRVWGLRTHGGRLYYGVWWENSIRPDPVHANEVWSIALNGSGGFVPGTDQLEITMPVDVLQNGQAQNYSNPVSDISFGPAGTMLLAERTMTNDTSPNAHQSRALEYKLSATVWIPTTNVFAIGTPGLSSSAGPPLIVAANSAGGVDYDFAAGGRVWVTGDGLHFGSGDYIYGPQGLPSSGGSIANSILIDSNGDLSTGNKTEIGDIEIPCPDCEINGTVVTPPTVGGSYTYQFSVTNHSNQPASNVVILPVSGVTSITPQTFHISPPLAPGQTSQMFTITLGGAQPGGQACFNIALLSADGSRCCSRQVCVPIPSCFEVLDQRVQPLPNNMVRVTVTLRSLESYTLYYAAISLGNGKTATPDFFTLTPPVPPLGITTISTIISPVAPGETVFYTLTVHYDELEICCSRDLSFTASGSSTPGGTPTPTPGGTPTPTPGGGPRNISTRLRAQTGENVGIGGFIITGSAPKHVLIRAIGPSLAHVGVPDVLADPVLELHGPSAFATITNDNWRDDPVQEAAILATGLAPTDNLESAIDATLNPGAYTAVVRGQNNTSGVALIEVYDLSQAVLAKLANISTRAFVGTGDNIVIAGFVLGGQSGSDSIALRGIGPSLTAVGVTNALADPALELRDGNGALLIANNDWQDDAMQASALIFAGLAPTNPLESGIAATLPPGTYTALLAGHNNGSGVGLVEFYDLGSGP